MLAFEKDASVEGKLWIHDVNVAAKAAGPYFKIAGKDLEWAAGEAWKGVKWCYNTPPCKAAAEKYGMMALEDGLEAAVALQQQQLIVILV